MSCEVFLGPQAEAQSRKIDAWWRENRRSASRLFRGELAHGLSLLSVFPEAGRRFHRASVPGVRRLLLRRSRHWIYYVHDEAREVVYVLALWSAVRGSDPNLTSAP